jgi:hypothetical protein
MCFSVDCEGPGIGFKGGFGSRRARFEDLDLVSVTLAAVRFLAEKSQGQLIILGLYKLVFCVVAVFLGAIVG